MALDDQMEMFKEEDNMGLMQEGGEVDPVSGNEVPPGGTQEGVRDDIEANVSEGEMVIPEDVVRYFGVEHFMKLRDEAKMGYKKMEAMGQMGNPDEASIPDTAMFNPGGLPFSVVDMEYVEDEEGMPEEQPAARYGGMPMQQDNRDFQTGGYVNPSTQQTIPNTSYLPPAQTMYTNTINPATGQPQVTAQPTVTPSNVGQITTPTTFTGTTMAGVNPGPVRTAAPVAGTTPPGILPTLPNFGDVTGGVTSFNFFRNEDGVILQIPVLNGRQIYDEPEGYQRFDPDNPAANPWTPDEPDEVEDEPEEEKPDETLAEGPGPDGTGGNQGAGEFNSFDDFFSALSGRGKGDYSIGKGDLEGIDQSDTDDADESATSDIGTVSIDDPSEAPAGFGPVSDAAISAALGFDVDEQSEDPDAPGVDAAAPPGEASYSGMEGEDAGMDGDTDGGDADGDTDGDTDGDADGGADADGTSTYTGGLIARRKLKKPTKRLRSNGKGFARRV
jgi:hypothetical protein